MSEAERPDRLTRPVTVEDIRAMFAGPVPAMMRKDEENFVQMNAPAVRLVAEEYVIGDKT